MRMTIARQLLPYGKLYLLAGIQGQLQVPTIVAFFVRALSQGNQRAIDCPPMPPYYDN